MSCISVSLLQVQSGEGILRWTGLPPSPPSLLHGSLSLLTLSLPTHRHRPEDGCLTTPWLGQQGCAVCSEPCDLTSGSQDGWPPEDWATVRAGHTCSAPAASDAPGPSLSLLYPRAQLLFCSSVWGCNQHPILDLCGACCFTRGVMSNLSFLTFPTSSPTWALSQE